MSCNQNSCLLPSFIVLAMLLSIGQVTNAGRQIPTETRGTSVKQSKCITPISFPGYHMATPSYTGGGVTPTPPTYSGGGGGGDDTTLPPSSGGGDDTALPPPSSGGGDITALPPSSGGSEGDDTALPPSSVGGEGDDTATPPSSGGGEGDDTTSPPDLGGNGGGGDSTTPSPPRFVPGLDDTIIPNPGVEVPIPQVQQVLAAGHH